MTTARSDVAEPILRSRTRSAAQRPRDYALRRLLAAADAVAVATGLALALDIAGARTTTDVLWALVSLPAWIIVFKLYGLYERDAKRVSHVTIDDAPWLFHSLLTGTVLLFLVSQALPVEALSLAESLAFFAIAFICLLLARATARQVAEAMTPPERVLLVGGGVRARLLVQKIRLHPEYHLHPVGFVDDASAPTPLAADVPWLGPVSNLQAVALAADAERIVVASPELDERATADLVRAAIAADLRISILPNIFDVLGPSVEIDDVEGMTVLGVNPVALTRSSQLLKRSMDVVVSLLALILLLPVMTATAVAVKLSSPGPIFYSQLRVGRGGRHFTIHKFRTMAVGAEQREKELRALSAHPAWLLLENDPRVTPIGRALRRYSLDELPQLWNVLKGDMSLVGPRPMPPSVDALIQGWGRRRLDLTPGITGLWQVLGRTNIPFEEMVRLDYLYVTNWSLWQDLRLLIHTLPAVLTRRGAN